MGMNYYLKTKPCKTCGHCKTEKHIGKKSCGWTFHFRGYRSEGITSYRDWLKEFKDPNKIIMNEIGEEISLKEMKEIIEEPRTILYNSTEIDLNQDCWVDDKGYVFSDRDFC